MSREFGDYSGGYFHTKIDSCADDCLGSSHKLTQLWGEFIRIFYDVAYEISNHEACDSGAYAPIMESIAKIPALKQKLAEIENHLSEYRRVAEEAVRKHEQNRKVSNDQEG